MLVSSILYVTLVFSIFCPCRSAFSVERGAQVNGDHWGSSSLPHSCFVT